MVSVSLDPFKKSNKPAIFMDCGIHAREWVSPAFCLFALDQLVEEQALLDQFDFYIVPVANPDGYVFSNFLGQLIIFVIVVACDY